MPVIDTAEFIGQLVLEAPLHANEPNDYVEISQRSYDKGVKHLSEAEADPLNTYTGAYWNQPKTFFITVSEQGGSLAMTMQGLSSQVYTLRHYQNDSFSWIMPFSEIIRRARSTTYYTPEYYTIEFYANEGGDIDRLGWEIESELPGGKLVFYKNMSNTTSAETLL
ncbi:hypothetical protein QBC44DRAFT_366775 [Cladorrhinum sp. PSN332]|nr:hypothetical protein QBC44DRAFT_366775 [Cladorrhinum sp. PSN332]